jgi:hypothetical protein
LKRRLIIGSLAIVIGLTVVMVLVLRHGSGGALHLSEAPAYYLPQGAHCTVLVDVAAQRAQLDGVDVRVRAAALARFMVEEFRAHGDAKAHDAKTVQLLAVYITGKDNYNRPDFSRRTDLLKLNGTREQIQGLSEADLDDWGRLTHAVHAEKYF